MGVTLVADIRAGLRALIRTANLATEVRVGAGQIHAKTGKSGSALGGKRVRRSFASTAGADRLCSLARLPD